VRGVDTVGVYRASFLDYGNRRLWILAPSTMIADPIPSGQLITGNLALAVKRIHAGGWAVLSQVVAAQHHLHVGQSFTLPSPRPTSYRLAALVTNLGWAAGAAILNASDYEKSWGAAQVSAYTFTLTPGAATDVVRRELRGVLGPASSLVVETAHHRESGMRSATRQGLSRLTQIAVLVLTAAILAMSTAMGALIWQRRTLLGRLKVQGYGRRVLWRALACESGLLLSSSCLIGATFGLYGQLLVSHALATVLGFPIIYSAGLGVAFLITALVSGVAVAVVTLLGYRAAGVRPSV
jgi:putative ABC transport system permease protein